MAKGGLKPWIRIKYFCSTWADNWGDHHGQVMGVLTSGPGMCAQPSPGAGAFF